MGWLGQWMTQPLSQLCPQGVSSRVHQLCVPCVSHIFYNCCVSFFRVPCWGSHSLRLQNAHLLGEIGPHFFCVYVGRSILIFLGSSSNSTKPYSNSLTDCWSGISLTGLWRSWSRIWWTQMCLCGLWCYHWTTSADINGQSQPPMVQDWLLFLHQKGEQIWAMLIIESMIVVWQQIMTQNSARLPHLCSIIHCDFYGTSCVLFVLAMSTRTTFVCWTLCLYFSSLPSGMESCSSTCKHWEQLTIVYFAHSAHYSTSGEATIWGKGVGSAFHFNTAHSWIFQIGFM